MYIPELSHSQNYLHSHALVAELVKLSSINKQDLVVEIGSGKGIITRQLASRCSRVVAVEVDTRLCERLKRVFAHTDNVEIICGDFLEYEFPEGEYKVFANIPFNMTSAILSHITKAERLSSDTYLILQKQAAVKYAGIPYSKESLKSLLIKPRLESSTIHRFSRTDFTPPPRVDTVLLRMRRRSQPIIEKEEYRCYRDFLCYVFMQSGHAIWERTRCVLSRRQLDKAADDLGFSATCRVIDLSFDQWLGLFSCFLNIGSTRQRRLVKGSESRLCALQEKLTKIHRTSTRR